MNPKQLKQLKQAQKRRDRRPEPQIILHEEKLTVSNGQRSRFTNQHAPMLAAVERALQAAYRQDPELDDPQIAKALECAFAPSSHVPKSFRKCWSSLPSHPNSTKLMKTTGRVAMRIIHESVQTHSNGPGSRKYLDYAARFLKRAPALR
ncbi:MAG: hypothetical protein R3C53_13655 [Pirellulaceae bacterium]